MRRPALAVLAPVAVAAALAGCGGSGGGGTTSAQASTPVTTAPTATVPAGPTLTAPDDVAACNELEANIRIVSQLIASSAEALTRSLHSQQLAKRTGDTRKNLLLAARVLSQIQPPASLEGARNRLVHGLRSFAADFGRAQKSVQRGDIAAAARQLVDRPALAEVTDATKQIDAACGG